MNVVGTLFNLRDEASLIVVALAVLGSIGVFTIFAGLVMQIRGKPRPTVTATRAMQFQSVQGYLDRAQIEISASEFVRRSLILGVPVGAGLFLLIGSIVVGAMGLAAGFIFTWTKLEQERDRKQIRYTKQLASACDTIRTAYGVNPSLKKALESVAEYGQSPAREDFREILIASSQERFAEGLQIVAERRRSIVFDTVAASLLRASEATGEVGDMLQRLAESTRSNVAAFEDAVTSQINARSNIQWGTYGPWLIFCVFRCFTLLFSFSATGSLFAPMGTFYSTPGGNLVALIAVLITLGVYRHCLQVSQRGLVVRRVAMSQSAVRVGQHPLETPQSALSAQSRPLALN